MEALMTTGLIVSAFGAGIAFEKKKWFWFIASIPGPIAVMMHMLVLS